MSEMWNRFLRWCRMHWYAKDMLDALRTADEYMGIGVPDLDADDSEHTRMLWCELWWEKKRNAGAVVRAVDGE